MSIDTRTVTIHTAVVMSADDWAFNAISALRGYRRRRPRRHRPVSEAGRLARLVALGALWGIPVGQVVSVREEAP